MEGSPLTAPRTASTPTGEFLRRRDKHCAQDTGAENQINSFKYGSARRVNGTEAEPLAEMLRQFGIGPKGEGSYNVILSQSVPIFIKKNFFQ